MNYVVSLGSKLTHAEDAKDNAGYCSGQLTGNFTEVIDRVVSVIDHVVKVIDHVIDVIDQVVIVIFWVRVFGNLLNLRHSQGKSFDSFTKEALDIADINLALISDRRF